MGGVRGEAPAQEPKHVETLGPRASSLQEGPGPEATRQPSPVGCSPLEPLGIGRLIQGPPGAP
eukprot:9710027-Alexandrium_andersonii.AAC.1